MKPKEVQAHLVLRDSSYRQFALSHGYQPRTVTQVVARWAGRDKLPNGRLSYRILRDLSRFIGQEVTTGVMRGDW
ncbi:MAG: hypothetical protein IE913_08355 [Halothiobacillus sp.]|nr:hypothetical protein [Halothiobacillus sp.]